MWSVHGTVRAATLQIAHVQARQPSVVPRLSGSFSSNLPNHNFANIWNEFDQIYQKWEPKNKVKKRLRKKFLDSYLITVRCHNATTTIIEDKPILHIILNT